jgi:ferredoxin/flavodoxin---NADP+ reductase
VQKLENRTGPEKTKSHLIIEKEELNPQVKKIVVYAPDIAGKAKAGQFAILRIDSEGERIPLTLVDWNHKEGTITLIFQEVGFSTNKLGSLNVGDTILNITGPLGNRSRIRKYGVAAVVCGGVGTAAAYPIARALKEAGNTIISIIGARSKELLILEEEMKRISNKIFVSTDDGSKGQKGFVSSILKSLISQKFKFNIVYAIGPPLMMKSISDVTRPFGIRTMVSLNPIMVDGMGMCGACRVSVAGLTKFACVDGPEFDGHKTNFEELIKRLKVYPSEEKLLVNFHENRGGGTCSCRNHK